MKNKAKTIIAISTVALGATAALSAISYGITKKLLNVALDRRLPQKINTSFQKLSGSGEDEAEIFKKVMEDARVLEGKEHKKIEIISRDNHRLVGHYFECENPKRLIIAMHGWRSSWSQDFGAISDFWHDNNCSVIYAEQRGQGESDGEYMGFGLTERHDCIEWAKWAEENIEENIPIYLAGLSMGATTVLMAADLELPDRIHGIMADCGYTSPHAIWKYVVEKNLHMPYGGIRGAIVDDMCKKKLQIGPRDCSTTEAMKKCTVPVLFIHGTDDKFVPIKMTYDNYKACSAPKKLLVVPGAGHGMSFLVDRASYEKATLDFWNDHD